MPLAYQRGLGKRQTQHTCILLEDITQARNLSCPACFAASSPSVHGFVPVSTILANADTRLARENGRLDVVTISGGEPTEHPEFMTLIDQLLDRNITRILINTNGALLAGNEALVKFMEKHHSRIETYFQSDGFKLSTHEAHRGADGR